MKAKTTKEEATCHSVSKSTLTEKTYVRACIILLALNFCLTGYVLLGMFDIQEKMAVTEADHSTASPVGAPTELLSTENTENN